MQAVGVRLASVERANEGTIESIDVGVVLQEADRRLVLQNQKFEAQLQAVKERLDQARGKDHNCALPYCRAEKLCRFSAKGRFTVAVKLWPNCQAAPRGRRQCLRYRGYRTVTDGEQRKPFDEVAERGFRVRPLR